MSLRKVNPDDFDKDVVKLDTEQIEKELNYIFQVANKNSGSGDRVLLRGLIRSLQQLGLTDEEYRAKRDEISQIVLGD